MSFIAASGVAGFAWVLLVLACPLMMVFMMRGMHGGHGHHGGGHGDASAENTDELRSPRTAMSLDELKRERDELNALIGERAEEEVARR